MKDRNDDERLVHQLTEAISGLTCAIEKATHQAHHEQEKQAILYRIEQKVDTIMANQAQLAADLKAVLEQQKKTAAEIAEVQAAQAVSLEKITALEEVIAAGVQPSQELVDAVAAVKAQAQIVDDLIPDVVVPPPTTP